MKHVQIDPLSFKSKNLTKLYLVVQYFFRFNVQQMTPAEDLPTIYMR